jgi:hypothetical protein
LDYGILPVRRITSESQDEAAVAMDKWSYLFLADDWRMAKRYHEEREFANTTADFDHSHTPKQTFSYFVSP